MYPQSNGLYSSLKWEGTPETKFPTQDTARNGPVMTPAIDIPFGEVSMRQEQHCRISELTAAVESGRPVGPATRRREP